MECTLCNYVAKTKGNYQRHCKTGKHIIKEEGLKNVGKRNNPQKIIEQLQEELELNNQSHESRIKYITEKHKEELKQKQNDVLAKISLEIRLNEEIRSLKATIDQMEKQLIKTIDISGNYVIGRKLI